MKKIIEDTISDMVMDLLYYDRKEDDELPLGVIDNLVNDGLLTADEIVEMFRIKLIEGLQEDVG